MDGLYPSDMGTCSDCGAHFALSPGVGPGTDGVVQGAACENCGGKRLYMDQPSPTVSEMTQRDMVDPLSQRDQGGNPEAEGTIMNGGSSVKATQPMGKKDESFPGTGIYSRRHFDNEPYMPWDIDYDTLRRQAGLWDTLKGVGEGIAGAGAAALPWLAGPEVGIPADAAEAAGGIGLAGDLAAGAAGGAAGGAATDIVKNLAGKAISPLMKGVLGQGGSNSGAMAPDPVSPAPNALQIGASTYGARYPAQLDHEPVYDEWGYPERLRAVGPKRFPWEGVGEHQYPKDQFIDPLREFPPVPGSNPRGIGQIDDEGDPEPEDYWRYIMEEPGRISSFIPMILADLQTPTSNPSIDEFEGHHDQQQFADGDNSSSNFHNPNLQDSGANGEDNVRSDSAAYQGFAADSPGIERARMIEPLLWHYYESPESGQQDPIIRALHETLEREQPGYLTNPHPEAETALQQWQQQRKPAPIGVHAGVNMQPPVPGTAPMNSPQIPTPPANAPGQQGTGSCPQCGATLGPNGSCPVCGGGGSPSGSASYPPAMAAIAQHLANHQGPVTPEQRAAVIEYLQSEGREGEASNVELHPEQYVREMAAIMNNPNVAPQLDPAAQNQTPPQAMPQAPGASPVIDPSQVGGGGNQQMMPMSSANSMMCPNCGVAGNWDCPQCHGTGEIPRTQGTDGSYYLNGENEGGWQNFGLEVHNANPDPNTVMDWTTPDNLHDYHGPRRQGSVPQAGEMVYNPATRQTGKVTFSTPMTVEVDVDGRYLSWAADSVQKVSALEKLAPGKEHMKGVSPKRNRQYEHIKEQLLESGDSEEDAKEEAARTVNKQRVEHGETKQADANNMVPRCPKCGTASTRIQDHGDSESGEAVGYCPTCDYDFPLEKKRQGKVATDLVEFPQQRIWADVEGNDLRTGGSYELHSPSFPVPDLVRVMDIKPGGVDLQLEDHIGMSMGGADFHVSRQEAQLENYSFVPVKESQASTEPDTTPGQSPEQVPPLDTTDSTPDIEPHPTVSSTLCKCGSSDITSVMSSPTTRYHECYRCGTGWETKEADVVAEPGLDLSWLNEDTDFSPSNRQLAMIEQGSGSRNLAEIAAKDHVYQEIKGRLNANEKIAGKLFTRQEKNELIDEYGVARNLDKLDLGGTHYTTSYDFTGKADGSKVRDEDLFLGI